MLDCQFFGLNPAAHHAPIFFSTPSTRCCSLACSSK
jgi:hypothetical protein